MTEALLSVPMQARSQRSLTRMLDATERLLMRWEFDDIAIADIAAEAQVSVGTFYTRFASKEALLDVLHERYEQERTVQLTKAFAAADVKRNGLAARAAVATQAVIELFRDRRGVLRSLILRYWRDPTAISKRTHGAVDTVIAEAHALLLGARAEIRHANPPLAVRVGFQAVLAAAREAIVLRPAHLPGAPSLSDKALARELANILVAYLTSTRE